MAGLFPPLKPDAAVSQQEVPQSHHSKQQKQQKQSASQELSSRQGGASSSAADRSRVPSSISPNFLQQIVSESRESSNRIAGLMTKDLTASASSSSASSQLSPIPTSSLLSHPKSAGAFSHLTSTPNLTPIKRDRECVVNPFTPTQDTMKRIRLSLLDSPRYQSDFYGRKSS